MTKLAWTLLTRLSQGPSRTVPRPASADRGFTLLELLVTTLISGAVVSGLLFLTNELLTTDQRESSRTETQRDLQGALDYINAELKEAVYVYENAACVAGDQRNSCAEIVDVANVNALPILDGTNTPVPVLAFWTQSPLTDAHAELCATAATIPDSVPCLSGNAYSLVVYAYSENANADGPWQGEAGIVRYEMGLTPDSLAGADTEFGRYVAPNEVAVNFRDWPIDGTAALGEPQILVDFVDNFRNDGGPQSNSYFSAERACPIGYSASPNDGGNPDEFVDEVGGFYVCVNTNAALVGNNNRSGGNEASDPASYGNQDVIVYLRGNASGRSGLMVEESFLPVIETRVLVRGALNRKYN